MKLRRYSILISLIIVLTLLLSACAGDAAPAASEPEAAQPEASQPEAAPETPAESEAAAPASDEQVTIRFQSWRLAEEPAATALTNLAAKFEAANPNIKVELEPVANADKITKLNTQVLAGNPPDVVEVNLTDISSEVALGAFLPLDDYIAQAGGDAYISDFTDFMVSAATVDGSIYAMPHEGDALVLYLNTKLWEAAGLDPINNPPKTIDDLKAANLALTDAANNQYAFAMWPGWQWMQPWFTAFGTDYFNADYSDTLIDSPEAIAAFTYYTGLVTTDKVVPPGVTEVNYGGQVALMAQEQVAYIEGPYATYGGLIAANPDLEPNLIAVAFPGPTIGRGSEFAIGNGSKNADAAWEFIKFMSEPESQLQFFEEGSMMPTTQTALSQIDLEKYPVAKVMIEEGIPNAVSYYPTFPEWSQCSTFIQDALTSTLLGQTEPEAALQNAAAQIREVLAQK